MKRFVRENGRRRRVLTLCILLVPVVLLTGCGADSSAKKENTVQTASEKQGEKAQQTETGQTEAETQLPEQTEEETEPPVQTEAETDQTEAEEEPLGQTEGTGIIYPSANGHMVCIDAGHQQNGDSTPEPVAPGAVETKARVSSGTTGGTSKVPEYRLTLAVSLKLRDELLARGYGVVMTRETNEVNISNSERAGIAKDAGADAFVRIHANGSDDSAVNGAMTICQTPSNPYTGSFYEQSRALSQNILDSFCAATGAKKQYVWETDTMSGINWSLVPVTILEMGYMTNPTEDVNMSSAEYQDKMVQGIADGIDAYYMQTKVQNSYCSLRDQ